MYYYQDLSDIIDRNNSIEKKEIISSLKRFYMD